MRTLEDVAAELDGEFRTADRADGMGGSARERIGKLIIEAQQAWIKETGHIRGFYSWASDRFKRSPDTLKMCATAQRHPGWNARENRKKHMRRSRQIELGRIAADVTTTARDRLTALKSAYLLLSTEDRGRFRKWLEEKTAILEPPAALNGLGRPRKFTEDMRL